MNKILVTGGAGYIGSHTIVELLNDGYDVVAIDNLSNSSRESLRRVEKITGKSVEFHEFDLRDEDKLDKIFKDNDFEGVMHFAGLKAVGESVAEPLRYYTNNIDSSLAICRAMSRHSVKKIVFSSSATVYGVPEELPLLETSRTGVGITNPYGQTKFMIEQILRDLAIADPSWSVILLRYFNPVGAHKSGLIGEDPKGIPNNIFPYIAQVAVGKREQINVFGDSYDTPDGTGVRDYIHVTDLARGHVASLKNSFNGVATYNLGTGEGTSVIKLIEAFSKAANKELPYTITDPRPGDVASLYADPSKAKAELGWRAELSIEDACRDSWLWQSQNPNGF